MATTARNRSINIYLNRANQSAAQLLAAYQSVSPVQVVLNGSQAIDLLNGEALQTFTFLNATDSDYKAIKSLKLTRELKRNKAIKNCHSITMWLLRILSC